VIRYLIWDAGGTLFDTYPATVQACRAALRDMGQSPPGQDVVLRLVRQSRAHAMRVLAHSYALDVAVLTARFQARYADIAPQQQPPFPGVVDICRAMCACGGQNFIITHRSWAALQTLLRVHRMRADFTACITRDDAYPRKPDPTSTLALLTDHHLDATRGLVIGDRDLDIQAGRAAGLRTCFLGTAPHLTPADLEITDYAQLQHWIQRNDK